LIQKLARAWADNTVRNQRGGNTSGLVKPRSLSAVSDTSRIAVSHLYAYKQGA